MDFFLVLFLNRGGENITQNLAKPTRFDFENSLGNGPKGVLRKSGQE